jgi:hypothetical protein
VLPNFLIIGAEKAATTWLARCLSEHPSAYLPPEKEIFFFSSRYARGIDWYARHFRAWSGQHAVGEATPVYLSHPEAAARIRSTLGEISLVVSVRHPVDRAYSAYWHNLRHGRLSPDLDFESAFAVDACEIRSRGNYATHLSRYVAVFPRDRLLVLVYDEIREDPGGEFRRSLRFLGLDDAFTPTVLHARLNEGGRDLTAATAAVRAVRSAMRSGALWAIGKGLVPPVLQRQLVPAAERWFGRVPSGWGATMKSYAPLSPVVRGELFERHYAAEVRQLQEMLGLDLSRWYEDRAGDVPPAAASPRPRDRGDVALPSGRA